MNILITGGSGFVGTHLRKILSANNNIVNIFNYDIVNSESFSNKEKMVICDIRKELVKTPSDVKIDCIINLAAIHKSPGHPENEYFETNIIGAKNVCKFASENNIKNIVFTSSIAVYGPGEDEKTEDSLQMPNIPYGISKTIAEYIHREWFFENKKRCLTIIRPAVIFGKGEKGNFSRIAKALKMGLFVYPGRKNTIKSCCYVKNICQFISMKIFDTNKFDTYNFCYQEKITLESICDAFTQNLGYKKPIGTVPKRLIDSASVALKAIPMLSDWGFDPARVSKLVNSTNISSEKLSLKYKPQYSLNEALKDWSNDCESTTLF